MTNAEIFRKAADYIREHGLHKGGFGRDGGPRCVAGAVRSVLGLSTHVHSNSDSQLRTAYYLMDRRLGLSGNEDFGLTSWNDEWHRTKGQVIKFLDDLAFDEDLKAAATADNPASGVMETSNPVEQTHDTASPSLLSALKPARAPDAEPSVRVAARARDRRTGFGKRLIEDDRALRVAYADPPYIGVAHRYPEREEVDHAALIARLEAEFPDGWALSAAQNSLRELLPMCPPGVRVGAWVKPFWGYKPGVSPGYAWEPVIYVGGRRRARMDMSGVKDWLSSNPSMGGTHGAHTAPAYKVLGQKPEAFCRWIFDLLNVSPLVDELIDLYPGSGAVLRAWRSYQTILPEAAAQG